MTQKKFIWKLIAIFCFLIKCVSTQDHLPPCTSQLQNNHFPSGFDCQSYFTCFDLTWVLQACPDFFWFQRTAQACEIYSLVHDCEFAPTSEPPSTTTVAPPPPTTIAPPRPNPVECPASGVVKVPNPYSCVRYFMCYDGVAVVRSCSPGLYFSRSQLRCVRRDDSDCLLDSESCPAENDPDNVVFLPDQENCQLYFVCYDGQPKEFDCGATLHWDPINNWCIPEEISECKPSYPLPDIRDIECPEDTENDIIFLPHPEECQFYFICINGESMLVRCSRNLLFDYIMEQCFFAASARCFNRIPSFLKLN